MRPDPTQKREGLADVSDVNWEWIRATNKEDQLSRTVYGKRFFEILELRDYIAKMGTFSLKKIKDINYPFVSDNVTIF